MIFTIKDLVVKLNEFAAEHGDGCLVAIDDADTSWELPLEEVYFEATTNRVCLRGDYHGEEFPTQSDAEVNAVPPKGIEEGGKK